VRHRTSLDGQSPPPPGECCPREFRAVRSPSSVRGSASAFARASSTISTAQRRRPRSRFSRLRHTARRSFPSRFSSRSRGGRSPERFMAEFRVASVGDPGAERRGLAGADRAVRVCCARSARGTPYALVRARSSRRCSTARAGNGCTSVTMFGASGQPACMNGLGGSSLSELGGSFAAGILEHARALTGATCREPVVAARLTPHRCVRSGVPGQQNREALLRLHRRSSRSRRSAGAAAA